ncbi:MAG: twin-arginine translocase subunit TatC [Anaerolineales bacterium]|jgi:sec-independent protein translocase protein TatC
MKSIFQRIGRILSAPFRLIARPFRALRDFINYEPDETPIGDIFVRTVEHPSVLVDHLEALRGHVLRSLAVLVLTVIISTLFTRQAIEFLARPIGGLDALQAIEVTESLGAFMRVALLCGIALAMPYIGTEIFAFLNPGLRRRERVTLLIIIPAATILFLLGAAFAYYIMFPAALPFLLNFLGISAAIRPANYIRFVTGLMFWIGVAFQFPIIIYALAALGIVDAGMLTRGWRFAVLGIAILAAAVTPTVDPVNMGLVMLPMIVLYFLSIGLAAIASRRRNPHAPPQD